MDRAEPPLFSLFLETWNYRKIQNGTATTEFQDRCLKPLGHPSRTLEAVLSMALPSGASTARQPVWQPPSPSAPSISRWSEPCGKACNRSAAGLLASSHRAQFSRSTMTTCRL